MNPINKLHAWVKTLPPALQTAYYAIETAVIAGLAIFLGTLYAYYSAHSSFAGFDWSGQIHTLQASVVTAILKAAWDLLKSWVPGASDAAAQPQKGP